MTRRIAVQMQIQELYKRHTHVFAGIHEYGKSQGGWRLIIDDWADHTIGKRGNKPALYDGLLGRISLLGAKRAMRLGIPAVNVHFSSPAKDLIPGVYPDFAACGRLRAEHLLARGFRNFGALFHDISRGSSLEGDVFESVARAANCDSFEKVRLSSDGSSIQRTEATYRDWRRAVRAIDQWMNRWHLPIGLYIREVDLARVVIEKCRERGWSVPDDVAIVSGYNDEEICKRPEPGITSLEVPNEQIGYEAAQLLDRLIDENKKRKRSKSRKLDRKGIPQTILLAPVGIVTRRSTDFYAIEDELIIRALRYMDANLQNPLPVDSVAYATNVSRRTLENHFREKLGRTIAGEVKRLRIERAKRELTGSRETIRQIAQSVGFRNTRTMNELFRKMVGCTPREYRRKHIH